MSKSVSRRRRQSVFACVGLLGLAGCGVDSSGAGGAGGGEPAGPRLELGTGRLVFEPAPQDGDVPLIQGLQGGYHVWTSFLIYGVSAKVVQMDLTTRWDGNDASLQEMQGNISLRPTTYPMGGDAMESLGWPAFIFQPTCADGQRILFSITVSDDTGLSVSDSREWIVDVAEEYRGTDCAL